MAVDRAARRLRSRTACPRRCRRPVRSRRLRRCRPRSRPARRGPSAVPRWLAPSGAGRRTPAASAVERVVELVPGHGLGAPAVAQLVRRLAREVERVRDAGEALRGSWRADGPLPAGVGERDQVAGQVAAVDGGDIPRIERAQIAGVVPVVEMPAEPLRGGPWSPASPPAARPLRWCPASRSRGRSPTRADRGRDWSARCGGPARAPGPPGNCPAAACGRPPSRRSRRSARCAARSAAAPARRPPIRTSGRRRAGDRLAQRAIAGEAIHSAASGTASGQVPVRRDSKRDQHRQDADDDAAGHHAIEAEQVEPRTDRRLGRRDPFEQMPAGDEQAHTASARSHRPSATPDAPGR